MRSGSLTSYAGAAPANADELAAAHKPNSAVLPPAPAGAVADVKLALTDINIEVAPGVHYAAWAWAGGAPGPVIHVRQGQLVKITLTNNGAIPHSVDFHAARIAPDKAFTDVAPGHRSATRSARTIPGLHVPLRHEARPDAHRQRDVRSDRRGAPRGGAPESRQELCPCRKRVVSVVGRLSKPAVFNMAKAHARQPDWMTFNGYAGQYVKHPLTAKPGELVRFWVVDAGPSLDTDFHIVGTILNTAYAFGDMNPNDALHNVQTVTVPAGGGGVFDVKIDQPGLYPFVSHAFAAVDQGQVGLLNIGNVHGTMSH